VCQELIVTGISVPNESFVFCGIWEEQLLMTNRQFSVEQMAVLMKQVASIMRTVADEVRIVGFELDPLRAVQY